jgi:hypothetical protein
MVAGTGWVIASFPSRSIVMIASSNCAGAKKKPAQERAESISEEENRGDRKNYAAKQQALPI